MSPGEQCVFSQSLSKWIYTIECKGVNAKVYGRFGGADDFLD